MTPLLWLAATALAHAPNIASYTLEAHGAAWTLDVGLPTDGMHDALQRSHPDERLSNVTLAAYEATLLDALQDGVRLSYDGVPAVLSAPVVALAAHESHVVFSVSPPPAHALAVEAHIDALRQHDQFNVFRVTTPGQDAHVVLREDNAFTGSLALTVPGGVQ